MSWWEKVSVGGPRFLGNAASADSAARELALAKFGCQVADARSRPMCGQWDYKKDIRARWHEAQTVDFSAIGVDEEVIFYYDIWANFHYGFVGTAAGFSQETLLTGAAIEHAVSNLTIKIEDDPSDRLAQLIGIHIHNYGAPSEITLLWWLFIEQSNLNKAEVDESGTIIRIYR